MLKMKVFWQKDCPNCPMAKEIGKLMEEEVNVEYYDVETIDGLSEACLFNVMSTPSIVIVNHKNEAIESWKGKLPEIDNIRKEILYRKENQY